MSNFKEVVKESIEKGIILDSCGEVERFYDYGRYIDLCGLDPKDIVENMQNAGTGGGGSSKTNVVINGVVTEENGEYYVVFKATSVVLDMITISMIIDGKTQTVTMQPGSTEAKFGPVEKYCEIENITVTPQSTSVAKYSTNVVNPNGKGLFNVSVIKVIDNEETLISTNEYKYKDIVKITASDIEGYDFINWDNGIENGDTINIEFEMPEHDVEVRCYYNIKTFTITWLDDDGTTKLASTTVNYGETPVYPNDVPSKVSTEEFNYKFKGWTPNVTAAKDNATYTAEYLSETRQYEILFVDEDGTELLRTDVEYGKTPTYTGKTPTKESSVEFDYTFSGWNPVITEVKGTATYTAQYTSQIRQYNITFIIGDDKVTIPVNYGETPVYPNGTPTKESDAQYTYTFKGWTPEITAVKGDAEYTAKFDEEINKYTVTWKNYNGDELETDKEVPYGETPEYNGATPTKESDAQYTYTFNNTWEPAITTVTGNTEYTAKFDKEVNKYTVTWKNYDGNLLDTDEVSYGDKPEYNGPTPTREGNAQYTYTFNDVWNPEITNETTVTGNTEYTAVFTEKTNEYDITFNYKNKNGEDTTSTLTLEYGTKVKEESDKILPPYYETTESGYTFSGWNPEITEETEVKGTAIYTAQYTSQIRQYNITFIIGDDKVTIPVNYGETPVYPNGTPTKESDAQYTYTFKGWTPDVVTVNGDASYTAYFEEIPKEYTLNINVENGTYTINPEKETYIYNDKVTIAITPEDGYEYSPLENIITITGDTTLNYVCEAKKYTLTVDGKVYENIPYNSDITPYLTYQPQEGMSHKWMEGDNVFDEKTMPNRDLTLTSTYEEFTESKMVYYGTDLLNNIENFTIEDVLNKNKQEYNGTEQEFIFNYSGASEDIVLEYEETFDEALEEACQQYYYIAIPSNKTVTIINAAKQEITQYFTIKNEQLIIDNTNYDQYTYRMTGVNIYPETIKLKIIIK